jgi:DNA processing protein
VAGVANCIPPVTSETIMTEPGKAGFPQRLTALAWSKPLYVRGVLADGPAVAVVGARAASKNAMQRAHAIGKHLAEQGVTVVSGGALGVDGAAHEGALAGRGCTIVVLGTGVDVAYPSRHAPLFERVVAAGGALVSMFPLGMHAARGSFVARNKLIAALADAVVVVEADIKSGSLSTAQSARTLGKKLAAMPGSPGTSRLLATGAALVEDGSDVIAMLEGRARAVAPVVLNEDARAVRDAIAHGASGIDSIVRMTGLSVRAVLRALPQLERYSS